MTVTLTGSGGLFTVLGKAILACDATVLSHGTTIPALLEAVYAELADSGTSAGVDLCKSLVAAQGSYAGQTALLSALRTFAQQLIIARVAADQPTVGSSLSESLDELIRQMGVSDDDVERNVVAATPADPHADAPNLIVSTLDGTGQPLEAIVPEVLIGVYSGATTLRLSGEPPVDRMHADWPDGSGANTSLPLQTTGLLDNPSFDLEADRPDTPDSWILHVGTPGTTVSITASEVQTIERTGTPTSGYFTISHTRSDSFVQTTDPLPFDATAGEVEAALRAFVGFSDVTVTWSDATKKWTINFNAVAPAGNQTALSCANTFDTGGLTVAEVTAGQAAPTYKALAILGTAASEVTTLRQRLHDLGLAANGVYAVSVQAKKVADTTGTLYLELVDGAGAVLDDDAGTDNQISIDLSTLSDSAFGAKTGFFRLPKTLPAVYYVQLRLSADLADTKGVYLDDLILARAQQLYTGGPFAALMANVRQLEAGDRYTITCTNGLAGKIQTWFWRWFGTLLPSDASPTIADP